MDSVGDSAARDRAGYALRSRARHADLTRHVISFGRELRRRELLASTTEIVDALRTVETVDLGDRHDVYLGLRSIFICRPEDIPVFDEVFAQFWRRIAQLERASDEPDAVPSQGEGDAQPGPDGETEGQLRLSALEPDQPADEGVEDESLPLYSPIEMLAAKDFSRFQADEMAEIARAVLIIAKRLATRESRRTRTTSRGQIIDPRRTLRRNMKYGGTIVELAHKRRKIRKPKLILICDVSRSMDTYSRFLLQFIHALQNTLGRVESFVFSTTLTRVTPYFKDEDIADALDRIAREVQDWSGGTRIGQSLEAFNARWAPKLVDRRSVVLILSDGLDTGEAEILRNAMENLAERGGKVISLNPLLGTKD